METKIIQARLLRYKQKVSLTVKQEGRRTKSGCDELITLLHSPRSKQKPSEAVLKKGH